jgi:hypothetical protein
MSGTPVNGLLFGSWREKQRGQASQRGQAGEGSSHCNHPAQQVLVVGNVAGESPPGRGQVDEALGVDEAVLLLFLDSVGEAQEGFLGYVDGKDAAGHDVEVARHGVERILLGADETEVVVELDEV